METRILPAFSEAETEMAAEAAAALLLSGETVAIPTETVYGLAANALDPSAVKKIFDIKGRPQDNPLIVHVHSIGQVYELCRDIPPEAMALALKFWPGPLSMVLKKGGLIPDAVSAGLSTVAVRCPSHPAALAVIRRAGVPLAAPSSNRSGSPSATTAAHVSRDIGGLVPLIVDGGPCEVGVESTIVDMTVSPPVLLRPGGVSAESLRRVLGSIAVCRGNPGEGDIPKAPGMKYRHYAPESPLTVYLGSPAVTADAISKEASVNDGVICFDRYERLMPPGARVVGAGPRYPSGRYASMLFSALRGLDGAGRILAQCPPRRGIGLAISNRLEKASGGRAERLFRTRIIGLTGGSGSGKSEAAAVLSGLGAKHIDCDKIYHRLTKTSLPMREELTARFGPVYEGGELNRRALGEIVFSDAEALSLLNKITHRYVMEAVEDELDRAERELYPAVIIDAPALFESGADACCDRTAALLSDRERMISRITARDKIGREYAQKRVASRDDGFFKARADSIIENNGSLSELHEKIRLFYRDVLEEE